MKRRIIAACSVAGVVAMASAAAAHDRSASRVSVLVTAEGARVDLALSDLDRSALARLGIDGHAELATHLTGSVVLATDRAECPVDAPSFRALASTEGSSRWEWRVRCDGTPARLRALPVPSRPSHLCFARVTGAPGATRVVPQDHVLSELAPEVVLRAAAPSGGEAFARFVPIGVEHILGGLDHVVFLLMLLLAARSLRHAAILATGFTLGHSITLAAAALGAVAAERRVVEALIGFSIALVAVDVVRHASGRRGVVAPVATVSAAALAAAFTQSLPLAGIAVASACYLARPSEQSPAERSPWRHFGLAAGFGLLHGLGFAGALSEVGLPPDGTVVALLGFNVGVELGQIAMVLAAWPLLAWSRRVGARRDLTVELCAAAGACAGTFWFVSRLLG